MLYLLYRYIFHGLDKIGVCQCSSPNGRVYIRLFLWQLKARETISTSLNACLTHSDQTEGPFPLIWLSLRQTWWLRTQGFTTLAYTCAEPTSRRPENLLPQPPSFTYLVESFYALNYLSFSFKLKLLKQTLFLMPLYEKLEFIKRLKYFTYHIHISVSLHTEEFLQKHRTLNKITLFSDKFEA